MGLRSVLIASIHIFYASTREDCEADQIVLTWKGTPRSSQLTDVISWLLKRKNLAKKKKPSAGRLP